VRHGRPDAARNRGVRHRRSKRSTTASTARHCTAARHGTARHDRKHGTARHDRKHGTARPQARHGTTASTARGRVTEVVGFPLALVRGLPAADALVASLVRFGCGFVMPYELSPARLRVSWSRPASGRAAGNAVTLSAVVTVLFSGLRTHTIQRRRRDHPGRRHRCWSAHRRPFDHERPPWRRPGWVATLIGKPGAVGHDRAMAASTRPSTRVRRQGKPHPDAARAGTTPPAAQSKAGVAKPQRAAALDSHEGRAQSLPEPQPRHHRRHRRHGQRMRRPPNHPGHDTAITRRKALKPGGSPVPRGQQSTGQSQDPHAVAHREHHRRHRTPATPTHHDSGRDRGRSRPLAWCRNGQR
jgi:hypothetical protein